MTSNIWKFVLKNVSFMLGLALIKSDLIEMQSSTLNVEQIIE